MSSDTRPSLTSLFGVVAIAALTFVAVVARTNEYLDEGIYGATDCDGPIRVMMFAIPAGALAISLAILAAYRIYANRSLSWYVVAVLSTGCLLISASRIAAAVQEANSVAYIESCAA